MSEVISLVFKDRLIAFSQHVTQSIQANSNTTWGGIQLTDEIHMNKARGKQTNLNLLNRSKVLKMQNIVLASQAGKHIPRL